MTPLDVIKVRLQIQGTNGHPAYRHSLDALRGVVRTEGVRALWSSFGTAIMVGPFLAGASFTMYETFRDTYFNATDNHIVKQYLSVPLASMSSRLVSTVTLNPLNLAMTRLQSNSALTISQIFKDIYRTGNYYAGLNQTLLRDVPFSVIYWTLNEPLRHDILSRVEFLGSFSKPFLSGMIAGWISALLTHPFDVVRTKQQTQQFHGKSRHEIKLTKLTMRQVVQTEGYRTLAVGIGPRSTRVSITCGIMLGVYDFMKDLFLRKNIFKN